MQTRFYEFLERYRAYDLNSPCCTSLISAAAGGNEMMLKRFFTHFLHYCVCSVT